MRTSVAQPGGAVGSAGDVHHRTHIPSSRREPLSATRVPSDNLSLRAPGRQAFRECHGTVNVACCHVRCPLRTGVLLAEGLHDPSSARTSRSPPVSVRRLGRGAGPAEIDGCPPDGPWTMSTRTAPITTVDRLAAFDISAVVAAHAGRVRTVATEELLRARDRLPGAHRRRAGHLPDARLPAAEAVPRSAPDGVPRRRRRPDLHLKEPTCPVTP
jgi:hypothetical protein